MPPTMQIDWQLASSAVVLVFVAPLEHICSHTSPLTRVRSLTLVVKPSLNTLELQSERHLPRSTVFHTYTSLGIDVVDSCSVCLVRCFLVLVSRGIAHEDMSSGTAPLGCEPVEMVPLGGGHNGVEEEYLDLDDDNGVYYNNDDRREDVEQDGDEYFGHGDVSAHAEVNEDKGEKVIVDLRNIHKTYLLGVEGVPALRGVTVSIRKGEFICIYGTSGGGKTSLLNIIGTIDKPSKGELFICGERINHRTTDATLSELRLRHIGFVFQTFNLLSSLTALENVEMPMILSGHLSKVERRTRAMDVLTRVGMGERLDHQPSMLSGGEQQRVTIARAIANRPELLLLDEPTGDLDTVNSAIVMRLLLDLCRKEKITLVMVTHDVNLKWMSDRVIWLRDGKIQRVEHVPQKKRNEALQALDDVLEEYSIPAHDEGGAEEVVRAPTFANTQIRMPTDYATNASYDKGHAESLTTFADHHASHPRNTGSDSSSATTTSTTSSRSSNNNNDNSYDNQAYGQVERKMQRLEVVEHDSSAVNGDGVHDYDDDHSIGVYGGNIGSTTQHEDGGLLVHDL